MRPRNIERPTVDTVVAETEIPTRFSKAYAAHRRPRFLKGPIPLDEIAAAARLPGSALAVLLAIRHRRDLTGHDWVTLPTALLDQLGIGKDAKSRGLRHLSDAGLIEVEQRIGTTARVRLTSP